MVEPPPPEDAAAAATEAEPAKSPPKPEAAPATESEDPFVTIDRDPPAATTTATDETATEEPTTKPLAGLDAKGLSFDEQKKKRAERFGITVADESKKDGGGGGDKKRSGGKEPPAGKAPPKKAKKQDETEEPLLPKDEIEKRLKRAEKFGIVNENTEKLKAMLRKHRFMEANPTAT